MVSGVLMNARDQRFYLTSPASYQEMIPDADVRKLARINSILFRPENAGRKVCLTLRRDALYPAELQAQKKVPGKFFAGATFLSKGKKKTYSSLK